MGAAGTSPATTRTRQLVQLPTPPHTVLSGISVRSARSRSVLPPNPRAPADTVAPSGRNATTMAVRAVTQRKRKAAVGAGILAPQRLGPHLRAAPQARRPGARF